MGSATESLNTVLGIDTTDFKTSLSAANRELRVLDSGFKASVSTMGDWAKSVSGLELRQESLTKQIDIQTAKVEALREEHQRLVDTNGETSISAKNAEEKLYKETATLGKMQTELEDTKTGLKNLKEGNDDAGRSTEELQEKQESMADVFRNSWTEINSMIGVAKQAWQVLKGAGDETVGAYVSYADQVRTLNQLNGNSAEANSRLIQLTDDYKISQEDLMSTQKELLKDEKLLSTDTLADIADKYVAATTQVEKNKIASDNLGKSWKSYIEILQQGGQAIRDQADAISGNLILTDESIQKARDYEKATDELSDSFEGLKVEIGEKVVPSLTDNIKALTKGMSTAEAYRRAQELGIKVSYNQSTSMIRINGVAATQDELLLAVAEAEKKLKGATEDTTTAVDGLSDSMDQATTSTDMFGYSVADGVDALQQANAEFSFIISFAKQYETNLRDVTSAQDALKEAEDELFAMSQPGWKGTASQLQTAQEKVDGLKTKLDEAKQASINATNEMIAGFLQTELAADGAFTEEDIQKVLNYRLQMGLLSQDAYQAALKALAVAQNLAGIPKTVTSNVVINTTYKYSGLAPGPNDVAQIIADAKKSSGSSNTKIYPQEDGGDYLVNKPTLFMAGEAGWERATFTPLNSGMNSSVKQFENAVLNLTGSNVNLGNDSKATAGGKQTTVNVTINATVNNEADIYKLSRKVVEQIKREK